MGRVPVGVEQADRGGGRAGRADVRDDARDLVVVEGDQRPPVRGEPLADADRERGIDQRASILLHQVVERAPRLPADADDVLETGGRDERHASPAALQHGVGRDRRSVHDVETGTAAAPATSVMPSTMARDGSSGVDRTLWTETPSGPKRTRSVNVPPVSTPTRIMGARTQVRAP